jgi:hypothetical protein
MERKIIEDALKHVIDIENKTIEFITKATDDIKTLEKDSLRELKEFEKNTMKKARLQARDKGKEIIDQAMIKKEEISESTKMNLDKLERIIEKSSSKIVDELFLEIIKIDGV